MYDEQIKKLRELASISEGEHKDAFGTHKWKTYAQIPTNADRIRAMTDEELAEFLGENDSNFPIGDHKKKWLEWLKQEASE